MKKMFRMERVQKKELSYDLRNRIPQHLSLSVIFLATVLMLLSPVIAFAGSKAYENIYYTGKTQNIMIKFAYAFGYIIGSELITTDVKTKKRSRFLIDSEFIKDNELRLYHHSSSKKRFADYFILEGMDLDSVAVPSRIRGKYFFNGSAYDFVLKEAEE